MHRLLLASVAAAGILAAGAAFVPSAVAWLGDSASRSVCGVIPDQCLAWRRDALEATRATYAQHRVRIQEGVGTLEAHAGQLRQRIDAIRANGQLLAQREAERRQRNAPTLDFAGRTYTAGDVEAQARLWAAEEAQTEATLREDVAVRRAQFAEARERVSLAHSRIESTVQMITADLLLAPVTRDLDRVRRLSAAADGAVREARELVDPVRSVLELPPLATAPAARSAAQRPAFDMEGWLRRNGGDAPRS
jgi:hypothetical protein